MHLSKETLLQFLDGSLSGSDAQEVEEHLAICELCRESLADYEEFFAGLAHEEKVPLPSEAEQWKARLFRQAVAGMNIPLTPLEEAPSAELIKSLAAHGEKEITLPVRNLSTFCSEEPEIVLRIMRDMEQGYDYLQLISDDPAFFSHVLVRVPELDQEFLTDENGKVVLTEPAPKQAESLNWQVKLPDAVFSLHPFEYNPDKTEYQEDITLETEKHDRIKVSFEGKTEGKLISITVLELNGKSEFGAVKVALSQQEKSTSKVIQKQEPISFELTDTENKINIRLFLYDDR